MANDVQLLAKAKQLDPTALRELHQRFYEPVARYIQFKVGDPLVVEDLSGEVFVRVLEGLRRGKAWRESPRGWILGIARNIVADYYRQRERLTEVELGDDLASVKETDPLHHVALNERKRLLMQAVQQLPEGQRDVILMRFIEGIDVKGVATAMNKTPGAVKALQHRALQGLAKIIQDFSLKDALGTEE
ncbi:MAG: RNA polymerase sigma factor [Anaerolineae bacterium]